MQRLPGFDVELQGPGLDAQVFRGAIDSIEADALHQSICSETDWIQDHITMFGKRSPVPRLTAWHGDPDAHYSYSGISMRIQPWTESLRLLRSAVEELANSSFNSVLLNLYRTGDDGVGWHADDESELGPEPIIASVSLGTTRTFSMRRKDDANVKTQTELNHGDVLIMGGTTQALWLHQVPKTKRPVGPRLNLTFRTVF